jgi:hypothetical protein
MDRLIRRGAKHSTIKVKSQFSQNSQPIRPIRIKESLMIVVTTFVTEIVTPLTSVIILEINFPEG